jgi:hypothetical protein
MEAKAALSTLVQLDNDSDDDDKVCILHDMMTAQIHSHPQLMERILAKKKKVSHPEIWGLWFRECNHFVQPISSCCYT